jgi:methylmalonyl-CoA mutase
VVSIERIRIVTAAALFDGHDVSISIFAKLMHQRGAEVIHIGHNRSVDEILATAIQEDVDAILVSSYQGGHNEFFQYLVDRLRALPAPNILVFGGGGGVILPQEIEDLQKYGVERIYHAVDGQALGIHGIADDIVERIKKTRVQLGGKQLPFSLEDELQRESRNNPQRISQQLSHIERHVDTADVLSRLRALYGVHDKKRTVVFGVTGTGGCGKSSLIDELINRFLKVTDDISIGVLAVDPSKKLSGGAFLGDRIRYNNINNDRVFFRSFATRESASELSHAVRDGLQVLRAYGFDIVFVETSGIGQGDSQVTDICDHSIFVMTSEFGGPSQLEKIDMLDLADSIVINKFEKIGSEDALRHVTDHYRRSRNIRVSHSHPHRSGELPIYAASSNQFNNRGVNRLFKDLLETVKGKKLRDFPTKNNLLDVLSTDHVQDFGLIGGQRVNYLTEIADTVKNYYRVFDEQARLAGQCHALQQSIEQFDAGERAVTVLKQRLSERWKDLSRETQLFLEGWEERVQEYSRETVSYKVQNEEQTIDLFARTLSSLNIPKVALPKYRSWEELVRFHYRENLPGFFPFAAGVFPFKRTTEDPRRQFAGEGTPERTNKRLHYLSRNDDAKRLSTAFDGITLYGEDPDKRLDIYGKIGESGVSICTIEDMERLYDGFDQTDPRTSVSMTINAPAPIILAMYFMVAYRRELQKEERKGRRVSDAEKDQLKIHTFRNLRGTVQADILKEDQGQNTCIFSIDFAMKLVGDVQEYFTRNAIEKYYSLSISGYHIAEAGANPITQLAFTLANGFTYVEYFLKRGLKLDDFAPNLSFFFSNGMEPEYSVIGRVARRIWAIAMKYKYHGNERSQKLKYHIQTSGRSLHAQEMDFNDIRTTLQALLAYYDNCNSLHTNSYDEAITTPTEESVRRSMAIQMILANEFGMVKNENPNQGSFIIEELTNLVEEAVLEEFYRISRRGGVMGAMETQYQRAKIQEESLYYEELKQSGEYPIVGVNTFLREKPENPYLSVKLTRTPLHEKDERLKQLYEFQLRNREMSAKALERLREVALGEGNIFKELLNTVQWASLGQITGVLYEIGGKYRRGF